ncbi:ABC transporter permease [Mycoplasma marinum]|uniref:ABC transporter permease n=1 Tax=Mycoplasma marinum TaxID=1937190 RepID=A0A4R0XM94_9MOLU|nr:hypothetical protein C4B24_04480 [Mycoplasma marinum]
MQTIKYIYKSQIKKTFAIAEVFYKIIYLSLIFLTMFLLNSENTSKTLFKYIILFNLYTWVSLVLRIIFKDFKNGEIILLLASEKFKWKHYLVSIFFTGITSSIMETLMFLIIFFSLNPNLFETMLIFKIFLFWLYSSVTLYTFSVLIISFLNVSSKINKVESFINAMILIILFILTYSDKYINSHWFSLFFINNWFKIFETFEINYLTLSGIVISILFIVFSLLVINRRKINKKNKNRRKK